MTDPAKSHARPSTRSVAVPNPVDHFGINYLGELPELDTTARPPRTLTGRLASRVHRLRWFFDRTGDADVETAHDPALTSFATVLFLVIAIGTMTMLTFLFMRGCL